MLTKDDAELLMRVGPGTPMGSLIRRTWIPACLSEELPEPDGDPIRVRLLGEDFVGFRDSDGRVGVMEEHCPHRGASLFFGRNEAGGLRCLYHGWKMDVHGTVLETPCEPAESRMRFHVKHAAYPVVEQGDVVWTYLGPPDKQPPFPNFWWTTVPPENRCVGKIDYACNYLQAIEGAIEHIHGDVLHSGHDLMHWSEEQIHKLDAAYYGFRPTARHYENCDTPYGFRFAGIKPADGDQKSVNVTPFVVPFHVLLAGSPHMFVPMDDEHTWYFDVRAGTRRTVDRAQALSERGEVVGVDVTPDRRKIRTLQNNYLQDRRAMRERQAHWSFSGIPWGKPHQDMAMIESMGPRTDWSKEHLGMADVVVAHMRQRMLAAVRRFIDDGELAEADPSIPFDRIRGEGKVMPADAPWQSVGAYAGEVAPAFA
ncbi:MAG: Rieske 2Fe-2S domain-containing protein [Chloroflexi bacterium]|nr:Rieske 2Fe-2S domain-containing protein [Chloroflexota bacterium]